jgi:hypothetical protein
MRRTIFCESREPLAELRGALEIVQAICEPFREIRFGTSDIFCTSRFGCCRAGNNLRITRQMVAALGVLRGAEPAPNSGVTITATVVRVAF